MILAGVTASLLLGISLAALVANRIPWQTKLPLVIAGPAFGFLLWHGISSQAGWPVAKHLPKQALLVSSVTIEPKAIYVWLIPEPPGRLPFDYTPSDGEPRAYRLPYSREQQAALQQAAAAQAQGKHVQLRRVRKQGSGTHIPRSLYRAYSFPAPLPPKEGQ